MFSCIDTVLDKTQTFSVNGMMSNLLWILYEDKRFIRNRVPIMSHVLYQFSIQSLLGLKYSWVKYTPLLVAACCPGDSDSKESACNAGDLGSIPGSRISPREENGNPLQYSCLENSIDSVHVVTKSQTQLSN